MRKLVALLLILLVILGGCTSKPAEKESPITDLEQLSGQKVGVLSGSVFADLIKKSVSEVEIKFYASYADLALALQDGKIKAIVTDWPVAQSLFQQFNQFAVLKETGLNYEYAFAFPHTSAGWQLKLEMDDFLQEIQQNGTWEQLQEDYLFNYAQALPPAGKETSRTLNMAVNAGLRPFAYFFEGEITGYEVALAYEFCQARGYQLKVYNLDFASTIPAVVTGKYDLSSPCIGITQLKAEQIYFSQPTYQGEAVVLSRNPEAIVSTSYWQEFKQDLYNNFIAESRWKLILQGLGTTLLIALGAGLGGTVLGLLLGWLRRRPFRPLVGLTLIFIRVTQGTPVLVLLMILYYVIFRFSTNTGILAAVVGFSLNFSAYVADILHTSIEAVEKGQLKAALALGYNRLQAYQRVVLPQALEFFLPLYRNNLISMVKSTSVVGYLAILDLTKVTDLIRNMTYEPFFPLLLATLLYFMLSQLLFKLLNLLNAKFSPRHRKRILKGVNRDARNQESI